MILLALAKPAAILEVSSINTQCTAFIFPDYRNHFWWKLLDGFRSKFRPIVAYSWLSERKNCDLGSWHCNYDGLKSTYCKQNSFLQKFKPKVLKNWLLGFPHQDVCWHFYAGGAKPMRTSRRWHFRFSRSSAFTAIHSLPSTTQLPRGETLFHLPLTHIQEIFKDSLSTTRKYSDFFACKIVSAANHQQPENIQRFFACKFVLAANHQQPENIQRLFRLQICLSRKSSTISRKYSKTFRQAINSSNQQQQPAKAINSSNQQQQPAKAISSNIQQQQPAATINSSNKQQQPAPATTNSNQHSSYQQHLHNPRRLPLIITTVPSWGYVKLEVDLGLVAR